MLQISQENIFLEPLLSQVAGLNTCNIIKKRLQHSCFPVKFAKLLRTPMLKNICEQLLLEAIKTFQIH